MYLFRTFKTLSVMFFKTKVVTLGASSTSSCFDIHKTEVWVLFCSWWRTKMDQKDASYQTVFIPIVEYLIHSLGTLGTRRHLVCRYKNANGVGSGLWALCFHSRLCAPLTWTVCHGLLWSVAGFAVVLGFRHKPYEIFPLKDHDILWQVTLF